MIWGEKKNTIFRNFHPSILINSIPNEKSHTSHHLRGPQTPPIQLLRSVRLEGIDAWDSASLLLRRVHRCLEPKDLPESLGHQARKTGVVGCWGVVEIFWFTTMMGIWGNVKNVRGGSFCEEGVVKGNVCFNGKKELHAVWYSLEKASNTSFFSVYACFSQSSLI